MVVRTRFAPSPTGLMHIGNLRTAVYAYVMAKHFQGSFILRIEDTDQKREVPGATEKLFDILKIFGINWDEYYIQSERKTQGIYQKAADKLIAEGHAFYCQCEAKNAKEEGFSSVLRDPCRDQHLSSGAIKLRVPDNETVSYHDFVLDKDVSWNTNTVYDATLLKSDGFPTYHLAAMTDDLDMRISHIMRGHDWMPSTPIHLLVFKYLGGTPQIGHLTDILSPKGGKLSKRRDSVFVESFLNEGYLPEALLNFVILLGWAPKDNRELFTLNEFIKYFDPKGFQKANPVFHTEKLDWFNGQYIRAKSDTEVAQLVKPYMKNIEISEDKLTAIVSLLKDRLVKLSDFAVFSNFFINPPAYTPDLWPDPDRAKKLLALAKTALSDSSWTKSEIDKNLLAAADTSGGKRGDFFMDLRIAVCGSRFTPPLTESMLILGQKETISRIESAVKSIKQL